MAQTGPPHQKHHGSKQDPVPGVVGMVPSQVESGPVSRPSEPEWQYNDKA